jgi:tRNA threonylcarbamoyl adenosine modification protein YeaZ
MDLLIEIQAFYEKINIMTVLSFHLQQNECFVAIEFDGKITERSLGLQTGETQGMVLVPFIQKVWQETGFSPITTLITAKGPGSFTSLRIALAAAQGLALAFPNAKIFSPTHFEVLAYLAKKYTNSPCLVLIDSKKGDFYGQIFEGEQTQPPQEYTHDQIKELLTKNINLKIISDFEPLNEVVFENRWITFKDNIATCQIELYKSCALKEMLEYQHFHPYYLHLPQYVKRNTL